MASSAPSRLLVFVSIVICLFLAFTCKFGRAYDDRHLGAAGAVADDFVPVAQGEEEEEGHDPEEGHPEEGHDPEEEEGHDPDLVFTQALECFDGRHIYSSCDEAYRLSRSGELDVPHEYTDEYCDGPCAKETGLVLDCIEQVFKHFRFYNKATVHDVRETVEAGCSYGPRRGDFDVAKHVKFDEDIARKLSTSVVYATVVMMMGWHAVF